MAGVQRDGDQCGSTLHLLQSLLAQTLGPSALKPKKQALQRWAFDVLLGYAEVSGTLPKGLPVTDT